MSDTTINFTAAGVKEIDIPDELDELPQLIYDKGNLPAVVYEIRDLLAAGGNLFDRGRILVAVQSDSTGTLFTHELRVSNIVMRVHEVCRPVQWTKDGLEPVTLSDRAARMYLELVGEWNVKPLAGITTAPLLRADGAIVCARGYDELTQMHCDAPPAVSVPDNPTRAEAEAALYKLRETFRTFPFADSIMVKRGALSLVDVDMPPGFAESGFHNALLTGVARSSLWLAPGVLIIAPNISGAGSGKGLLARAIAVIAYGMQPSAFTAGDAAEFEKRLGAALLTGRPVVLIDNVNGRMLRSDTLASVITERPAEIRILGYSKMQRLNSAASIMLTGNGLTVTEDLARRFLLVYIDAKMENPETRPFQAGFLHGIARRRTELLEAALTILRWGRQHADQLMRGRPLGSFEEWAEWVRDPLLTLGCADPVEEMLRVKQRDPQRQDVGELFAKWHELHDSDWVTAAGLHEDLVKLIDPLKKGRQFVTHEIIRYVDTRIGGFVLTRMKTAKWSPAKYRLVSDGADGNDAPAPPEAATSIDDPLIDDPPWRHLPFRERYADPAYRRWRAAALSRRIAMYERGEDDPDEPYPFPVQ